MKKLISLLGIIAVFGMALAYLPKTYAAKPADLPKGPDPKVDVCHLDYETGLYHLINVSENSLPAHLAHGDGVSGDLVPGYTDKKFAEDCSFVHQLLYVETVTVPADEDLNTLSLYKLESGKNYLLKAYGTANAGDYIDFDARYSFRSVSSTEWTDAVSTYEYLGTSLLDLLFNGTTPWGVYNSSHEYEYEVAGDGNYAAFLINDVYYPNNTGNLYVDIYQKLW